MTSPHPYGAATDHATSSDQSTACSPAICAASPTVTADDGALLGFLRPWDDITFGDRLLARSRASALARLVFTRAARGEAPMSRSELWLAARQDIPGRDEVYRDKELFYTDLIRLREAGVLSITPRVRKTYVYPSDLPFLPVRCSPQITDGEVRRIVTYYVLECHTAYLAGQRATPWVNVPDVCAFYRASAAKAGYAPVCNDRLSHKISGAFRLLGKEASDLLVSQQTETGRLRQLARHDAGCVATADPDHHRPEPELAHLPTRVAPSALRGRRTDVVLSLMREVLSDLDPPLCTIGDISLERLSAAFGKPVKNRGVVSQAVYSLCQPQKRQLLVNTGVLRKSRYIALAEHGSVAAAAFALLQASAQLDVIGAELRDGVRRAIPSVAAEWITEIAMKLCECERRVLAAAKRANQSVWIATQVPRLRRRIDQLRTSVDARPRVSSAACGAPLTMSYSGLCTEVEASLHRWGSRMSGRGVEVTVASACAVRGTSENTRHATTSADRRPPARGKWYATFHARTLILLAVADPSTKRLLRIALNKVGPSPSLQAMVAGLGSDDTRARMACCMGLGVIGDWDAVQRLDGVARADAEPAVRTCALWALLLLAPARAEVLIDMKAVAIAAEEQRMLQQWTALGRTGGPVSWCLER